MISLLVITTITPAFAEVTSLQTNSESFYKGDQITFSGIVEKDSIGLVTIVIRDLNDKFVILAQAVINHDNTFEKTIKIGDKFLEHGIYNVAGFILNMTKGVSTEFGVSLTGVRVILEEAPIENEPIEEKLILEDEPKKETEVENIITTTSIADFVDSNKSS